MEQVKKHITLILCVLSIIMLALPLASIVNHYEMYGQTSSSKASFSGFDAFGHTFVSYFLVIGPGLLLASEFLSQLKPYRKHLSLLSPIVSLVALVVVVMQAESFSVTASSSMASAKVSLKVGIGAILYGILQAVMACIGAGKYYGFSFNKESIQKVKSTATEMIATTQDKLSSIASTRGENQQSPSKADAPNDTVSRPVSRKTANTGKIEDILSLIDRLSQMKDAGILTEEEFSEKKKQLLEEI